MELYTYLCHGIMMETSLSTTTMPASFPTGRLSTKWIGNFSTETIGNDAEQSVSAIPDLELDCLEFEGSPYEDADIGNTRHIGY